MELPIECKSWKTTYRSCHQGPHAQGKKTRPREREGGLLALPQLVSAEAGTKTPDGSCCPAELLLCLMTLCCPQIVLQGSTGIVYESFKCKN